MSTQLQRLSKPAFVDPAYGPRIVRDLNRELDQALEPAP